MNPRSLLLVMIAGMLLVGTVGAIAPPVADFVANETTICLGDTVAFINLSENFPDTLLWDFGDGNVSTLQNPEYAYGYSDTFTVTLTATNAAGSDVMEKKAYIIVTDCAGNPDFSADVTCHIGIPITVQFTGYCTNPTFKHHWIFGDGNTSDDIQSPENTYSEYGVFTVSHSCDAVGYDPVNETKIDYIVVGVEGTYCSDECRATFGSSGCSRGEEPNYLIIGATIGLLFGVIIVRRNGMK